MPQQFLHGTDVIAGFQQVRGERVAQAVSGWVFAELRPPDRLTDRAEAFPSWRWCRPRQPVRGSTEMVTEGNTYCQRQSVMAVRLPR